MKEGGLATPENFLRTLMLPPFRATTTESNNFRSCELKKLYCFCILQYSVTPTAIWIRVASAAQSLPTHLQVSVSIHILRIYYRPTSYRYTS